MMERDKRKEEEETGTRNDRVWNKYELFLMAKEETNYTGRNVNKHLAAILERSVAAVKNRRARPDYIASLKEVLEDNMASSVSGNEVEVNEPSTSRTMATSIEGNTLDPNREWSRMEMLRMAGYELRYDGRFPNRHLATKLDRNETAVSRKRRTIEYKRMLNDLKTIDDNEYNDDDLNDAIVSNDTYVNASREVLDVGVASTTEEHPSVYANYVSPPRILGNDDGTMICVQPVNEDSNINNVVKFDDGDAVVEIEGDVTYNGECENVEEPENNVFKLYLLEIRPSLSDNLIFSEAISKTLDGTIEMEQIDKMLDDILRCRVSPAENNTMVRTRERAHGTRCPEPLEHGYRGRAHLYKISQQQYNKNVREFANKIIDGKDLRKPAYRYPTKEEIVEHYERMWGDEGRTLVDISSRNERLLNSDKLLRPITIKDIENAMASSKSNSAGPDGMKLNELKRVPKVKLAALYNILIASSLIPTRLKQSRTILIPKTESPTNILDWRPISIASTIVRTFHRILAKRIDTDKLTSTQRGFVERDGLLENVLTMQSIIKECRHKLNPHVMITVDIKKAFDTVSHRSIKNALIRAGMPELLSRYIMETLHESKTFFDTAVGKSDEITLNRGVKQGDPLSPKLFILVIDELLQELDRQFVGLGMGSDRITSMAYADDLVLWATDRKEGQMMLRRVAGFVESRGMALHPDKCMAITVEKDHHRKRLIINDRRKYFVGPDEIKTLNATSTQKYLGHSLDSMGFMEAPLKKLITSLNRLNVAALKPYQKYNILKTYLIPRYIAALQSPVVTMKNLKQIDYFIRTYVKRMLHLPKSTPNAVLYAPKREGGLGIFCFRTSVPQILKERIDKLKDHGDAKMKEVLSGNWIGKLEERLDGWSSRFGSTKEELKRYWGNCLEVSVSGGGLRQDVGIGNNWLEYPPKNWGGRGFISAIQLRYNMLPCAGGLQNVNVRYGDKRCRSGCQRIETMSHVLQKCPNGHDLRIYRHDRIVNTLAETLRLKPGRQVEIEPRIRGPNGILRKPDLVINEGECITILEIGVHWEGPDCLDTAADNKIAIYSDEACVQGLKNRYGREKAIRILPFIVGARGVIPKCSAVVAKALQISNVCQRRIINEVICDGIKIHKQFMRTVWARGHRNDPR